MKAMQVLRKLFGNGFLKSKRQFDESATKERYLHILKTCSNDVYKSNASFLITTSLICVLLIPVVIIFNIISSRPLTQVLLLTAVWIMSFLVFNFSFKIQRTQDKSYLMHIIYIFYFFTSIMSLICGIVYNPNVVSSTFIGIQILFSIVVLDKNSNINISVIICGIIFIISAYLIEPWEIALYDIFNCAFFDIIGFIIGRNIRNIKLKSFEMKRLLSIDSHTDSLTGVYNRKRLNRDMYNNERHAFNDWQGAIMVDIDFFKKYNDCYGHIKGDECLVKISSCLMEFAKKYNFTCYRFGGEEFVLTTKSGDYDHLKTLAFEAVESVDRLNLKNEIVPNGNITISAGFAVKQLKHPRDMILLINMADKALYCAKSRGRNTAVGFREYCYSSVAKSDI